MNILLISAIIFLPASLLMLLTYHTFKNYLNGMRGAKILKKNLLSFVVVLMTVAALMLTVSAAGEMSSEAPEDASQVQQVQEDDAAASTDNSKGLGLLAAGIVTGLAGIGGGIAVAAGAPAAIAATSEDPKSFGKSLIFVALGESIALYGVVISILILGKL